MIKIVKIEGDYRMDEHKRLNEIDILKGIGIILMIMGHIEFGKYIDKFIYSYHIPLFFIVSGILYSKSQLKFSRWIKKKAKSLLIPYISFGVVYLMIAIIQNIIHMRTISELKDNFFHFAWFNTDSLAIAGAIWFLTALFITELIFYLIDHLNINDSIKKILILMIFVMGIILSKIGVKLPWGIGVSFVGTLLFFIGIWIKQRYLKIVNQRWYLWAILFLICLTTIFINGTVNLRLELYSNPILFIFNASSMTIILLVISFKIKSRKNIIMNEIIYIGKNSIVYLCLNEFVLFFLKKILLFSGSSVALDSLLKVAILLCSVLLLHLFSMILNSNYFSFLIGKKVIRVYEHG